MRVNRRSALSLFALGAAAAPAKAAAPELGFLHGVASGDPRTEAVVIWTRVTPDAPSASVTLRWEVAEDDAFARIVARGELRTGPERDHTAKADVRGLKPGRAYRYRFIAGDRTSPVGRTRTLPAGAVEAVRLAVVTCSLMPAGLFNAYDHIAREADLDAVLHLGDYIYEYGAGPDDYGVSAATPPERLPQPPHELLTLADYRTRHAQYKRDADLQAAHAAHPWIVVWDDHEVCNDSWKGGGENHQPKTEGPWSARKAAAVRAYYEWMPIREPEAGKSFEAINRSFDFGDLLTLVMLESRLLARTQQLEYEKSEDIPTTIYDVSQPKARTRVTDKAALARVRAELKAGRPAPAPYAVGPDVPALRAKLADPARGLLGPAQEAWLAHELKRSAASGRTWQVLGNQVVMARCDGPDVFGAYGEAAVRGLVARQTPELAARLLRLAELYSYKVPFDLDGWDGYPAARERLLKAVLASGGNTVVVSGDSHAFWVNGLADDATHARAAAEFGTSSITSPSLSDSAGGFDLGRLLQTQNPEVKLCDERNKGWIRLTATRAECRADLIAVPITAKPYAAKTLSTWTVTPTAGPGVGEIKRV